MKVYCSSIFLYRDAAETDQERMMRGGRKEDRR